MYKFLSSVGLEDYLVKCCGGVLHEDSWLRSLDVYVSRLSLENLAIIKEKINEGLAHLQKNDLLHEIEIALVFYPNAIFAKEINGEKSPDLIDPTSGISIEVKTLNEGLDEQDRHTKDSFLGFGKALNDGEKEKLRAEILQILRKKTQYHLRRAAHQLNNNGKIYLIFDYNFIYRENIGTKAVPVYIDPHVNIIDDKETKEVIGDEAKTFAQSLSSISVEIIYHGDLREMVRAAIKIPTRAPQFSSSTESLKTLTRIAIYKYLTRLARTIYLL